MIKQVTPPQFKTVALSLQGVARSFRFLDGTHDMHCYRVVNTIMCADHTGTMLPSAPAGVKNTVCDAERKESPSASVASTAPTRSRSEDRS